MLAETFSMRNTSTMRLLYLPLLLVSLVEYTSGYNNNYFINQLQQTVSDNGYASDISQVVTGDGYNLRTFRIRPQNESVEELKLRDKPAVLMIYGMFGGVCYNMLGYPKSSAFYLVDNGYDVWLGTTRDQDFLLDYPDARNAGRYWDFSHHEMGTEDLPALIDHVIQQTGKKKIFLVNFSQGTTVSFVALSQRPEYNSKVIANYCLGPLGYLSNSAWYYKLALGTVEFLDKILAPLGFNAYKRWFLYPLLIYSWFVPINPIHKYDSSKRSDFAKWIPQVVGAKQCNHVAQNTAGTFNWYDYGIFGNFEHYGQMVPPAYNVSNIVAPTYLIYAQSDFTASPIDVQKLYNNLPKGNKFLYQVRDAAFEHMDFVMHDNLEQLVFAPIIESMQNYD